MKEPKIISMGQIDLTASNDYKAPQLAALPIIATRNLVLFPGVSLPIALIRESSLGVAQRAFAAKQTVGLCCQLDPRNDFPASASDVAQYGVLVDVLQIFDLPDGTKSAFLRSGSRFKVKGAAEEGVSAMAGSILNLSVSKVADRKSKELYRYEAMRGLLLEEFKEYTSGNTDLPGGIKYEMFEDLPELVNNLCTHIDAPVDLKLEWLKASTIMARAQMLLKYLSDEVQKHAISKVIYERAREDMSEEQRMAFMRKQMEVIQREIYGDVDDADSLQERSEKVDLTPDARKEFDRGLAQLRRLSPSMPDYAVTFNYLNTMLELPWGVTTPLSSSLAQAKEQLDQDHFGMKKVKQRVIEQVAVAMSNPEGKAPILCLVGAPGVGKTSLGQSVAKALGRNYQRVSLGGVSDEAEIRGHRRTYIGAMPGRIIDALRKAGSANPLLVLDEVDKLARDIKGDPSSALLEVLDPEQNCKFHDNFVDVDFDLSKVMFIATANTLDTIPRPLLDRMEVVEVPGYLVEEKMEIARRHLISRVEQSVGFDPGELRLSDEALRMIIERYTAESGVRQLEKTIASVARKLLVKKMEQTTDLPAGEVATAEDVEQLLGKPRYNPQRYESTGPGVVTGLAWTAAGGEILFIESSLSKGKGERPVLTGNLGDVMKESAAIALQYVKSHAVELGIDPEKFEKNTLHIHVPEGAVPKDGPSAGITMATSIASTFTGRSVKPRMAMTGEITLRGRVLAVGGIKEKILAAKRAGITDIILSADNRRDIDEIEADYRSGLNFHFVTTADEVLNLALLP